jgi:hypothetical protein
LEYASPGKRRDRRRYRDSRQVRENRRSNRRFFVFHREHSNSVNAETTRNK